MKNLLLLEDKAREPKKELSCLVISLLFFPPIVLGIYYWFIDDIIFSYDVMTPFSGFLIFFAIALFLTIIVAYIYASYWKSYNLEIDKANETICQLIKDGNLSEETSFRLKKDYIERKIKTEDLTMEEFEWHSSHFCWGCGKLHDEKKYTYTYERKRTITRKRTENGIRMFRSYTYKKSAAIPLCLECYNKLKNKRHIPMKWNFDHIPIIKKFLRQYIP